MPEDDVDVDGNSEEDMYLTFNFFPTEKRETQIVQTPPINKHTFAVHTTTIDTTTAEAFFVAIKRTILLFLRKKCLPIVRFWKVSSVVIPLKTGVFVLLSLCVEAINSAYLSRKRSKRQHDIIFDAFKVLSYIIKVFFFNSHFQMLPFSH